MPFFLAVVVFYRKGAASPNIRRVWPCRVRFAIRFALGYGDGMQNPYDPEFLRAQMTARWKSSDDLYVQLNRLRDWVNAHVPGFELYLEDEWNKRELGFTDLEYHLRSKRTYNELGPLGYDRYHNHRDAKGVWHLDDYVVSVKLMDGIDTLVDFIQENLE